MAEWLSSLRLRLQALLRRRQLEQDLQEEVAFHLAMREEQLRKSGATDAGAAARRRFGSVTRVREELRESWALAPAVSGLLRDFRNRSRRARVDGVHGLCAPRVARSTGRSDDGTPRGILTEPD